MTDKPVIHAAGLSYTELNQWLSELVSVSQRINAGVFSYSVMMLPGLAASLGEVLDDVSKRINYLESDQIIRAVDRSTVVLEDLEHLRCIQQAIADFLSAISPYSHTVHKTENVRGSQSEKAADQE